MAARIIGSMKLELEMQETMPLDPRNLLRTPSITASHYTLAGSPVRTKSPIPLDHRLLAAESAGYSGLGINKFDVEDILQHRSLRKRIQYLLETRHISIVELEMFWGWWQLSHDRRRTIEEFDLFRRVNDYFGPLRLHLGPPPNPVSESQYLELQSALQYFDDRAATDSFKLGFEFQHGSGISSMSQARRLFRDTNLCATGLIVDSWHFFRGRHVPIELSQPLEVPILALQLCDGPRTPELREPFQDTVTNRLVPGDGEFALVTFLSESLAVAPSAEISVEIINPLTLDIPIRDFAKHTFARTTELLSAATSQMSYVRSYK